MASQGSSQLPSESTPEKKLPEKVTSRSGRPVLHAVNLHKCLGQDEARVHVLRGITLSLERGRFYSLVGPSGCGKTTLLYMLGLLDTPDTGEISVLGNSFARATDRTRTLYRNRHIGFIFQLHFLLPEFTVLENVMLPMEKEGSLNPEEMREHAYQLLYDVGLESRASRMANHLSGGEQQRVAIARALANRPELVLADEPTGNLDTHNSSVVFDILRRLSAEKGQTILMATHNQDLAARTDQTFFMNDGLIIRTADHALEASQRQASDPALS